MQPKWHPQPQQRPAKQILQTEQPLGQKGRGQIGPADGQPKDDCQQPQHNGDAPAAAGQHLIQPSVGRGVAFFLSGHHGLGQPAGFPGQCGHYAVRQLSLGNAPFGQQSFRLCHRYKKPRVPPEIRPQVPVQLLHQRGVALQQPQRHPPGSKPPAVLFLQHPAHRGQCFFYFLRVPRHIGPSVFFAFGCPLQQREKPRRGVFLPGGTAHHRHPQQRLQPGGLYVQFPLFGFVQADGRPRGDLQGLQNQVKIPFQAGGVADDAHRLRPGKAQEIPGHLLLRGMGQQRISTGQIHQTVGFAAVPAEPFGAGHRFAGPVAGVLVQAGHRVEQRAFAHIGVAGHGYGDDLPRRDFRSAGHHTTTRRIVTVLASSLRMATAAPRMRYALGSPPGLCPTHSTRVPGTSPRSKSRRRIRLSVRSSSTSARWPGVISSR